MIEAKLPDNEQERLAALRALNVLETPIEERFERVTRMLCRTLNVPLAAITLVDETRQWFKSIQGAHVVETPRCVSFCAHAILSDSMMVVTDTTLDPRFERNPFVIESPKVRFYAGQPLSLGKNIRFGTLCALDLKPRELSTDEVDTMRDLARIVESELTNFALSDVQQHIIQELNHAERTARIDPLTRLWNRNGLEKLLQREWDFAMRKNMPISVVMANFDNFKNVNDAHGTEVGDQVLRNGSHLLLSSIRTYDAVGRTGGDEFMLILPACSKEDARISLRRIQQEITRNPIMTKAGPIPISMSMGAASTMPKNGNNLEQLVARAEGELLKAKKNGKGQIEIAA